MSSTRREALETELAYCKAVSRPQARLDAIQAELDRLPAEAVPIIETTEADHSGVETATVKKATRQSQK